MANFQNNAITDNGRALLSHVQMGAVFTPTKIVLGSGYMPAGKTPRTMTAVQSAVATLSLSKKERTNDGKFIVGGVYSNQQITEQWYFRELGLYAKAVYPAEGDQPEVEVPEVLYSYGNAGDTAELMPAYGTGTLVERQIDIVIYIGNDAQVDLTLESSIYISMTQLEQYLTNQEYVTQTDVTNILQEGDYVTNNDVTQIIQQMSDCVTADSSALQAGSIVLTIPGEAQHGMSIKFEAPCNSEDVSVGIVVEGVLYQWHDTLGEDIAGMEALFVTGTMVGIIIDRENVIAYLVNAAPSKGYIEYPAGSPPAVMVPGALYGEVNVDYSAGS